MHIDLDFSVAATADRVYIHYKKEIPFFSHSKKILFVVFIIVFF